MTETLLQQDAILDVLRQYWGYESLRPLQYEAIEAALAQRDSLVVMPTGGGKSLCYQIPPVMADRLDVVVSPLISLMKDQVDGLRECGYPAAALHSQLTPNERRTTSEGLRRGDYRLLFVSPERLMMPAFLDLLETLDVRSFAIDEAHCISHWGHDFRPEYRQLASLKTRFPGTSLHAFTATATPRVQTDIVHELRLTDPNVLVGSADRPNLVYRIVPRTSRRDQILRVVRRHPGQAVIVYCLSRKDTEEIATYLASQGLKAACYHAGLDRDRRARTQDEFTRDTLDIVVATVAFGMGIDRSDVRCVIHACMPKSIEHYQQETGRAGRDGLEAECVLLYSAADVIRWQELLARSAGGLTVEEAEEALEPQLALLRHMQGLASTLECRHRALSRYFGQAYEPDDCKACDVCLGEVKPMADSTTVAQKILSCVARLEQRFGVSRVVQVLRGADNESIRQCGHEQLSTYGLLREIPEKSLTNLVYQLLDQDLLVRTPGDRPILMLNENALAVLRGEREVLLVGPKQPKRVKATVDAESWEGVDRGLFEQLRSVRRTLADERSVPPYVIFGDATLREMATIRPTNPGTMSLVKGVGEKKLADLGPAFIDAIHAYAEAHDLTTNVGVVAPPPSAASSSSSSSSSSVNRSNPSRDDAVRHFADGASVEDVVDATGRTLATVISYLEAFIEIHTPEDVDNWVPRPVYDRVMESADRVGATYLRTIFDDLEGQVPYEAIRIVLAHRRLVADRVPAANPDTDA